MAKLSLITWRRSTPRMSQYFIKLKRVHRSRELFVLACSAEWLLVPPAGEDGPALYWYPAMLVVELPKSSNFALMCIVLKRTLLLYSRVYGVHSLLFSLLCCPFFFSRLKKWPEGSSTSLIFWILDQTNTLCTLESSIWNNQGLLIPIFHSLGL